MDQHIGMAQETAIYRRPSCQYVGKVVGPVLEQYMQNEQRLYCCWPNVGCTTLDQRNYFAVGPTTFLDGAVPCASGRPSTVVCRC